MTDKRKENQRWERTRRSQLGDVIRRVLKETKSISETARRAKVSRNTVYAYTKSPPVDRDAKNDALRHALRTEGADISAIVSAFGLTDKHALMFRELLTTRPKKPNLTEIGNICGFSFNTVKSWARLLQLPSQVDTRAAIIYELSGENPGLPVIAQKNGVPVETVFRVVALTKSQGRFYPKPKEDAIRTAIGQKPDDNNYQIAAALGDGFSAKYVADVRRKLLRSSDQLPYGITQETLFLDAAAELVRRHLERERGPKLNEIKARVQQPGWMPLFEGKNTWPSSLQLVEGVSLPKNRFLDAALTVYLQEAGIEGHGQLAAKTEKSFVQLDKLPLPIFQALHYALAARDVTFDRLKIQHGYYQNWLPSRSQMIITAKQVMGLKR